MKNWEKYEKEIKEIGVKDMAMIKNTGEIIECMKIGCSICAFYDAIRCKDNLTKWLYSDYKEQVVLTDDERKLCELLGDGWIARDRDGRVYHYNEIPVKNKTTNIWAGRNNLKISNTFPQCKFEFIKWEDEEPWEVKVDD